MFKVCPTFICPWGTNISYTCVGEGNKHFSHTGGMSLTGRNVSHGEGPGVGGVDTYDVTYVSNHLCKLSEGTRILSSIGPLNCSKYHCKTTIKR